MAAKIASDFGVQVRTYKVDVRDYPAVEATVAKVVEDFGRLDVIIANAGVPSKAGGLDDKVEDWDRVRAVDFDGTYYCMRAAGRFFRTQGRGVAIITSSMSGHAANVPQEQSCYNACKAGTVSFPAFLSIRLHRLPPPSTDSYSTSRFTWQGPWPWSGPNGEVG